MLRIDLCNYYLSGSEYMNKIFKVVPLLYYYIAAIAVYFFLFFTFCKKSHKIKTTVLYLLCIINFVFYIINDYYAYIRGDSLLTMMPFQLCNIAVFLIPLSLFLKKELIFDFVFYICAPGALAALIVPSKEYIGAVYSLNTVSFFIFHYSIMAIPLLLTGWGMYKPAPTIKKASRLSITVLILAGFMHILNIFLGSLFHVRADYFFTIIKYSAPTNIVFKLLSKIIPYDFLYLLPALIILYIYMLIVYLLTASGHVNQIDDLPISFKDGQ